MSTELTTRHQPLPPFAATSGPKDARIFVIGEAWGESEQKVRRPFAGESGKELWLMLGEAWEGGESHRRAVDAFKYDLAWTGEREAWLNEQSICLTNVFAFRPSTGSNKLEAICGSKAEMPKDYVLPALDRGLYVRPEFLGELDRLFEEIAFARPNLIVCLGNVATWAVLRTTGITVIRGAVTAAQFRHRRTSIDPETGEVEEFTSTPFYKVLPTFHPAGVLRQWAWRPIVVADLMKARRESGFAEIRRPQRSIVINPTLAEIRQWTAETLQNPPSYLAPDTETEGGQIKCIGFARSRSEAIVIPFFRDGFVNVWTEEEEREVWCLVAVLLESHIPKVGQNWLYDLQYLTRMAIRPRNNRDDTMLLHHSIFPEMQKGLGFLGSIYTNEASWKLMRRRRADEPAKRDE